MSPRYTAYLTYISLRKQPPLITLLSQNLIISHTKLQMDESRPQLHRCLLSAGIYGTCVLPLKDRVHYTLTIQDPQHNFPCKKEAAV